MKNMSYSTSKQKVSALRKLMSQNGVDAYYVPREDEHNCEYPPIRNERLCWISGFEGSAGMLMVMQDQARLFVNGIYTLQAKEQTDSSIFDLDDYTDTNPFEWVCQTLEDGKIIGLNPKATLTISAERLEAIAKKNGVVVKYLEEELVDILWENRPKDPCHDVFVFEKSFAGESYQDKIKRVSAYLRDEKKIDFLPLSELGNIAWLLNLRGADIETSPFFIAYGFLDTKAQKVELYIDFEKLPETVKQARAEMVDFYPYDSFEAQIMAKKLSGNVLLDKKEHSVWIRELMQRAGLSLNFDVNPITFFKSQKNEIELDNIRQAHVLDGVALCKFFKWFDDHKESGALNEYDVTKTLYDFRAESNAFRGVSFPAISGYAGNGALPHYRVQEETAADIKGDGLYLLDSGGQYLYGTTDLTRVVGVGSPTQEMKKYFTAVLKSHIAFATAVFPLGSVGSQLDVIARKPLWDIGADYGHGTGHGVGMYLSVHEGPVRFTKSAFADEASNEAILGAVMSNEPAYYRAGEFGIRIENLVIIKEAKESFDDGRKKLYFETISFVPIEKDLILKEMLSEDEIAWLNAYHAKVFEELSPSIREDVEVLDWLKAKTSPLK